MGEDKSLLPFANFSTITQYQLAKLNKIFQTVYISCKDKSKFSFDANFIEDIKTNTTYAPTAGFVAIFDALHVESFFALSVDSPFVSENEINKIIKEDALHVELDATIAKTSSGIQPMCGVYHRSLEHKFKQMLQEDNHKLSFLLKSSNTLHVEFANEEAFLNLNNPQEYQQALKLI